MEITSCISLPVCISIDPVFAHLRQHASTLRAAEDDEERERRLEGLRQHASTSRAAMDDEERARQLASLRERVLSSRAAQTEEELTTAVNFSTGNPTLADILQRCISMANCKNARNELRRRGYGSEQYEMQSDLVKKAVPLITILLLITKATLSFLWVPCRMLC